MKTQNHAECGFRCRTQKIVFRRDRQSRKPRRFGEAAREIFGPREGDSHGSFAFAWRYAAREEEGVGSAGAGIEAGGREIFEQQNGGSGFCASGPPTGRIRSLKGTEI